MRTMMAILTVMGGLAGPASGAEPPAPIAVMPLAAKGVQSRAVTVLDDLLVALIQRRTGRSVIGSADIEAMLGLERLKDAMGCDNVSCMSEISGALGADLLVTGSVGSLGHELIISLSLMDAAKARVLRRSLVRVEQREELYADAIERAVGELVEATGPSRSQPPRASSMAPEAPRSWADQRDYSSYVRSAREAQVEPLVFDLWQQEIKPEQRQWMQYLGWRKAELRAGRLPGDMAVWRTQKQAAARRRVESQAIARRHKITRGVVAAGVSATSVASAVVFFLYRGSLETEYMALRDAPADTSAAARADLEDAIARRNRMVMGSWACAGVAALAGGYALYELLTAPPEPRMQVGVDVGPSGVGASLRLSF